MHTEGEEVGSGVQDEKVALDEKRNALPSKMKMQFLWV